MKSTFSILFYLKGQARKDGLYVIMTRITINGKTATFSSKQAVKRHQWDQKRGRMIGATPRANSINLVLDVIKADLVEKYNYHHILRRETIDAKRLKDLYQGIDAKPSTLLAYFDSFNETQSKIVGKWVGPIHPQ